MTVPGLVHGVCLAKKRLWAVLSHGGASTTQLAVMRPGKHHACATAILHPFAGQAGHIRAATRLSVFVTNQSGSGVQEFNFRGRVVGKLNTSQPAKFIDTWQDLVVVGSPRSASSPCVIETVNRNDPNFAKSFTLPGRFIESMCFTEQGHILVSHCDVSAPWGHAVDMFAVCGSKIHTLPVPIHDAVWETRVHRLSTGNLFILNVLMSYAKQGYVFDPWGVKCLRQLDFDEQASTGTHAYHLQESFTAVHGNTVVVAYKDGLDMQWFDLLQTPCTPSDERPSSFFRGIEPTSPHRFVQ